MRSSSGPGTSALLFKLFLYDVLGDSGGTLRSTAYLIARRRCFDWAICRSPCRNRPMLHTVLPRASSAVAGLVLLELSSLQPLIRVAKYDQLGQGSIYRLY